MRVDLTRFFANRAKEVRAEMARFLRRGRGVGGRFLRQKKANNGRPLGFGRTASGIPGLLSRGRIRAFRSGFVISYRNSPKVGWFHRGFRPDNRPSRPIVGVSNRRQTEILEEAANEVALQINRILRSRR